MSAQPAGPIQTLFMLPVTIATGYQKLTETWYATQVDNGHLRQHTANK